ncbi:hypothetical protein Anas_04792 [Armadillidium nasatum]|uniref:Uncharacterized protein n=1 Tax=Armadillidium nasatum TaxID=96803 RepID=A0A5N5TJS6_9CRUS|nr:hypothetical protein Anas_04792 [Armadillidium nasatum]
MLRNQSVDNSGKFHSNRNTLYIFIRAKNVRPVSRKVTTVQGYKISEMANPKVFFDISIDNKPVGRIVCDLKS